MQTKTSFATGLMLVRVANAFLDGQKKGFALRQSNGAEDVSTVTGNTDLCLPRMSSIGE